MEYGELIDSVSLAIGARYNYWVFVVLMCIGLYGIIVKRNLIKKIIGLSIFQTGTIFLFISMGVKRGATIPVIDHSGPLAQKAVQAADYMNPLPHVLMLTAIVVSVATLGVALALAIRMFHFYGTLEENEILENIRSEERHD